MKESKFVELPSAKGKRTFTRQTWNIYRIFGTNRHYYHLRQYDYKDKLVKENIDPNDAIELVNYYNNLKKNRKNIGNVQNNI